MNLPYSTFANSTKFILPTFFAASAMSALLLFSQPASATKSTTVTVDCSKSRLQAAIDSALSNVETTIQIKGKCVENITVQPERNIILKGAIGASISPKVTSTSAIRVKGSTLTIKTLSVSNDTGAAYNLISASDGAVLDIMGSLLSAPNSDVVVDYMDSTGSLINNKITGGVTDTMESTFGSSVHIIADPSYTGGLNGSKMEIIGTSGGNGAGCWIGSSLSLEVYSSGGVGGTLTISNASTGLMGRSCGIVTKNDTDNVANLAISNNRTGVFLTASTIFLRNILIENSQYQGAALVQSSARLH